MGNKITKKSIHLLTDTDKQELTKYIFPKLEQSEIELAWKEIGLCLNGKPDPDHVLTFTQYLRANMWLKTNGYAVVRIENSLAILN